MDERQLAAQIYGWHNDEGLSLQAIVQRLNATGVPTRTGRGQWYQASVSEFLRQQIPQRKAARTEFLARYGSGPHTADEVPAPKPPAKRPQTRKAAPVG